MRVDAPHTDVVMGHEYCAELVAYGPGTKQEWPIGTRLTSPPALFTHAGMRIIGMAPEAPGGFGEYFLLSEGLARPLPDDLPAERLALIDAMAVGWYYTRVGSTGEAAANSVPLVVGLGAIGLAVVAALRRRGIGPIVASDFSESRRKLAVELGADIVVDPGNESPWAEWRNAAWGRPEEVHDRIALDGQADSGDLRVRGCLRGSRGHSGELRTRGPPVQRWWRGQRHHSLGGRQVEGGQRPVWWGSDCHGLVRDA